MCVINMHAGQQKVSSDPDIFRPSQLSLRVRPHTSIVVAPT